MHAEAAYWALLTEPPAANALDAGGTWLADLLACWLQAGNRSVRELFELHPDVLAAALGRPVEELAPLLALRSRLVRAERLLAGLARAGVDLLTPWDRRYPRALRGSPGVEATPLLWFAGSLDLLARQPIAVLGTRDAPPEALAFARALAGGLAEQGHPVLGGVSRAIERAALEAALAVADGAYVAVLGQGIGRALPDLQRLQGHVRTGRLLLISPWHPESFWQPHMESLRSALIAALSARIVLAQTAAHDSTCEVAQRAVRDQRPVHVRAQEDEDTQALLALGAHPVAWPGESTESLVTQVLASRSAHARSLRETPSAPASAASADIVRAPRPRRAPAAAQPAAHDATPDSARAHEMPFAPDAARPAAPVVDARPAGELMEALMRVLHRRRGVIGKGSLLQSLAVPEADLDRALATLIAEGRVVERPHRTGAGYAAVRAGTAASDGGFQLSLFGHQEE